MDTHHTLLSTRLESTPELDEVMKAMNNILCEEYLSVLAVEEEHRQVIIELGFSEF